jgi:hypothetical protein
MRLALTLWTTPFLSRVRAEKEFDSPEFVQETLEVLSVKLRAKATDLPAQKDELVALVKALRKTLKVRDLNAPFRALPTVSA